MRVTMLQHIYTMTDHYLEGKKQETHQMVGPGETPRHSSCKISADIPCVKPLPKYSTLPAGPVLRTFVQYSVAFCGNWATDVISSMTV